MNAPRLTKLGLAVLSTASLALSQEPGDRIDTVTFEHVIGTGAPAAASEVSLAELRGRVLILEYWATW